MERCSKGRRPLGLVSITVRKGTPMGTETKSQTPWQALAQAAKAWDGAPIHVKAMAGAYVGPIFEVLRALASEVDGLKAAQRSPEGGSHGH